jgi:hypothetical protein
VGSDIFSAQYQQSPVPAGGVMIKRDWLRYYAREKLPPRTYRVKIIQSWDTAGKLGPQNDWSVFTTWLLVDDHFYLLEVTRDRFDYPTLRDTAVELAKRFEPDFVLTGLVKMPITRVPVERDKGAPLCSTGKICSWSCSLSKERLILADLRSRASFFSERQDRRHR